MPDIDIRGFLDRPGSADLPLNAGRDVRTIMTLPAESWKQATEIAARKKLDLVYHDYDTGHFGACAKDDLPGHFKGGAWIPHTVFSINAGTPVEDITAKEKDFLAAHPGLAKATT